MKRVSFKVAKAIKEAGYPQDTHSEVYLVDGPYIYTGGLLAFSNSSYYKIVSYLEVWLWLWQEKDIEISIDGAYCTVLYLLNVLYEKCYNEGICNPEEAIIEAIEHLVDNNLIK